ncbi:MAG: heavy metal translocating P-type ATPase, partial [Clostridia bacterium]|nr:heavy metal translocating P-type ATPase [Clostridia bacterium]
MVAQKIYRLDNLCCPSCAAKIEKAVGGLDGVRGVSADAVTGRLILEFDEKTAPAISTNDIEKAVKGVEPDVRLVAPHEAEPVKSRRRVSGELTQLLAGAVLYAAAMLAAFMHAGIFILIPLFVLALVVSGGEVYLKTIKSIARGRIFDENLLMSLATVVAFAIGSYEESVAVMLLYRLGEYLQHLAAGRSRRSIAELMDLRPDYANLLTPDGIRRVAPQQVAVGDLIAVMPGEKIPLDGMITEGSSFVDTSGLTGEATPRAARQGGRVSGGFINKSGMLTIRAEKTFGESTVSKIIELVQNASGRKAKAEHFITKFARIYTPAVVAAALLIAVVPPLALHAPFYPWIYRALVFLVVSCPCALVISVPLGFFAGIGAASSNGILIKGANYLEALSHLDTVVFDKTGTLTEGVFKVTSVIPASGAGFSQKELLETAALAEVNSGHPAAESIVAACERPPEKSAAGDFRELAGMGVVSSRGGDTIAAGNERLMAEEGISFERQESAGTLVYVAKNGLYIGCIVISDVAKPDAAAAVAGLRALGVTTTALLTGDRTEAAMSLAAQAGIGEVHACLMPDQKVAEYERIAARSHGVAAFVGDGINDAPVLARADIGIAMVGAGSDAAVEAADIVI